MCSSGAILSANHLCELDGKRLLNPDEIVASIVDQLEMQLSSGACIDEHTADQLILYCALASEPSSLLVAPRTDQSSMHLETMVHFISVLVGARIEITDAPNMCRLINCRPHCLDQPR